jgi:hypothetical protein
MSKWQYFKSLYFLTNIIKCRSSSGNLTRSTIHNEESQNREILDDDEIENVADRTDDEDSVGLIEKNAPIGTDNPSLASGTISQTSTLETPPELLEKINLS